MSAYPSSGHVERLGGAVNQVIDGLHCEVERHELADGSKAGEGGSNGEPRESHFGDGRIDDAVVAVLLPQALADLNA